MSRSWHLLLLFATWQAKRPEKKLLSDRSAPCKDSYSRTGARWEKADVSS